MLVSFVGTAEKILSTCSARLVQKVCCYNSAFKHIFCCVRFEPLILIRLGMVFTSKRQSCKF